MVSNTDLSRTTKQIWPIIPERSIDIHKLRSDEPDIIFGIVLCRKALLKTYWKVWNPHTTLSMTSSGGFSIFNNLRMREPMLLSWVQAHLCTFGSLIAMTWTAGLKCSRCLSTYTAEPHLSPSPVAVFIYYGCITVYYLKDCFSSSKTLWTETPYPESRFAHFFEGPPIINPTPPFFPIFNSSSFLPHFSRNAGYKTLFKTEFEDRSSVFLW